MQQQIWKVIIKAADTALGGSACTEPGDDSHLPHLNLILLQLKWLKKDGDAVQPGDIIAEAHGSARYARLGGVWVGSVWAVCGL